MFWIWIVFFFCLGAIIGSFLNVVIYRLGTGKSLSGRSHCMSCGHTLAWYELFPIISYIAILGHCKHCHAYVPMRYMLVEVFTGILFVALSFVFYSEPVLLVLQLLFAAILMVILVYDLRHMIIPDRMVLLLMVTSIAWLLVFAADMSTLVSHLLAGAGAGVFFGAFWFVSKGRWMGLGDAKLALPLGIVLGPYGTIAVLVLSFWIGAAVGVAMLVLQHLMQTGKTGLPFWRTPLTMKSEIPFAPFLIISFWCVIIFHVDFFTLINLFTLS